MKRIGWRIVFGLSLIVAAAILYVAQIAIFHRSKDTFFYMLQDFAFVPIQVLLVTLIVSEVLKQREKASLQHKMNMVVGAFFNEVGDDLLQRLSAFDGEFDRLRQEALVHADWSEKDFASARRFARESKHAIDSRAASLNDLKALLMGRRAFLLGLLGNPNLMEHESFTDLLWATCHLTDELARRKDLTKLPEPDYDHLSGDITRAYRELLSEWLSYAAHLRRQYPYMYSLVVRVNPFNPDASPEIR